MNVSIREQLCSILMSIEHVALSATNNVKPCIDVARKPIEQSQFMSPIRIIFHCLAITCAVAWSNHATAEDRIRVLIVDGFGNHDWAQTTKDVQRILKTDANLSCEVSTVPAEESDDWKVWLPKFSEYAVVIQNTTDIRVGGSWPKPAQAALESYVGGGGGLFILHSANNAFPEWGEYNEMIGLGWRKSDFGPAVQIVDGKQVLIPAGEGGNTGHGKRIDTIVTRLNDHPIHAGLPEKWMAADLEIYRYARGPANHMKVISYAREPKTGIDFPIEWTIKYKQGRVYNSTYGHRWHNQKETPPGIRCVAFQTIFLRSIYWLAGQDVPSNVPGSFPNTEEISLVPPDAQTISIDRAFTKKSKPSLCRTGHENPKAHSRSQDVPAWQCRIRARPARLRDVLWNCQCC